MMHDQTGSGKSNMAASKLEIHHLEATIFDFSPPVKLNNIPNSVIGYVDPENIDIAFKIAFLCCI
jgi:hypothetical protein